MSLSTIPEGSPEQTQAQTAWLRRAGVVLVGAFVVVASQLGADVAHQVGTSGDLSLTLTWAREGRRGLAVPVHLEVTPPPGADQVTVWINTDYLNLLDHNAWIPEPIEMRQRGQHTGLVYAVEGDRLLAGLDSRFAPSVPPGRHPLELIVESEGEEVTLRADTWLVP